MNGVVPQRAASGPVNIILAPPRYAFGMNHSMVSPPLLPSTIPPVFSTASEPCVKLHSDEGHCRGRSYSAAHARQPRVKFQSESEHAITPVASQWQPSWDWLDKRRNENRERPDPIPRDPSKPPLTRSQSVPSKASALVDCPPRRTSSGSPIKTPTRERNSSGDSRTPKNPDDPGSEPEEEPDYKEQVVAHSPDDKYLRYAEEIGTGSFKAVYKGLDNENGAQIAWCELHERAFSPNETNRFRDEADMLKQLHNPFIVRFYDCFEIDSHNTHKPADPEGLNKNKERKGEKKGSTIVLVTELMTSGTLKSYIKMFKQVNLRLMKKWGRQILKGLHYLHTQDPPVIHRDLKCDNIFITGQNGSVKIGDLGLATLKNRSYAKSVIGTPEFMAPEMYDERYDEMVDVYAFGMCLLEMATSEYPYSECGSAASIYHKVVQGIKPKSLNNVENADLRLIISKCIEVVPEARYTVLQLLSTDFFAEDVTWKVEQLPDPLGVNFIKIQLRMNDPKKGKAKLSENEAIQFDFDILHDNPEQIVADLVEQQMIMSEDKQRLIRRIEELVVKNQVPHDKTAPSPESETVTTAVMPVVVNLQTGVVHNVDRHRESLSESLNVNGGLEAKAAAVDAAREKEPVKVNTTAPADSSRPTALPTAQPAPVVSQQALVNVPSTPTVSQAPSRQPSTTVQSQPPSRQPSTVSSQPPTRQNSIQSSLGLAQQPPVTSGASTIAPGTASNPITSLSTHPSPTTQGGQDITTALKQQMPGLVPSYHQPVYHHQPIIDPMIRPQIMPDSMIRPAIIPPGMMQGISSIPYIPSQGIMTTMGHPHYEQQMNPFNIMNQNDAIRLKEMELDLKLQQAIQKERLVEVRSREVEEKNRAIAEQSRKMEAKNSEKDAVLEAMSSEMHKALSEKQKVIQEKETVEKEKEELREKMQAAEAKRQKAKDARVTKLAQQEYRRRSSITAGSVEEGIATGAAMLPPPHPDTRRPDHHSDSSRAGSVESNGPANLALNGTPAVPLALPIAVKSTEEGGDIPMTKSVDEIITHSAMGERTASHPELGSVNGDLDEHPEKKEHRKARRADSDRAKDKSNFKKPSKKTKPTDEANVNGSKPTGDSATAATSVEDLTAPVIAATSVPPIATTEDEVPPVATTSSTSHVTNGFSATPSASAVASTPISISNLQFSLLTDVVDSSDVESISGEMHAGDETADNKMSRRRTMRKPDLSVEKIAPGQRSNTAAQNPDEPVSNISILRCTWANDGEIRKLEFRLTPMATRNVRGIAETLAARNWVSSTHKQYFIDSLTSEIEKNFTPEQLAVELAKEQEESMAASDQMPHPQTRMSMSADSEGTPAEAFHILFIEQENGEDSSGQLGVIHATSAASAAQLSHLTELADQGMLEQAADLVIEEESRPGKVVAEPPRQVQRQPDIIPESSVHESVPPTADDIDLPEQRSENLTLSRPREIIDDEILAPPADPPADRPTGLNMQTLIPVFQTIEQMGPGPEQELYARNLLADIERLERQSQVQQQQQHSAPLLPQPYCQMPPQLGYIPTQYTPGSSYGHMAHGYGNPYMQAPGYSQPAPGYTQMPPTYQSMNPHYQQGPVPTVVNYGGQLCVLTPLGGAPPPAYVPPPMLAHQLPHQPLYGYEQSPVNVASELTALQMRLQTLQQQCSIQQQHAVHVAAATGSPRPIYPPEYATYPSSIDSTFNADAAVEAQRQQLTNQHNLAIISQQLQRLLTLPHRPDGSLPADIADNSLSLQQPGFLPSNPSAADLTHRSSNSPQQSIAAAPTSTGDLRNFKEKLQQIGSYSTTSQPPAPATLSHSSTTSDMSTILKSEIPETSGETSAATATATTVPEAEPPKISFELGGDEVKPKAEPPPVTHQATAAPKRFKVQRVSEESLNVGVAEASQSPQLPAASEEPQAAPDSAGGS